MYIRQAEPRDAPELLKIYAPYVKETAITFDYDVPTEMEFARRIERTQEKYPFLVAVEGNSILGYAYAGVFKDRAAYDWAAETTVYVDRDARGRGCGRALYAALEEELKKRGIRNAYACIAYADKEDETLTHASPRFHEALGYALCGRFHRCGYKFGRWYDMIWMEKLLDEK